ncbi:chemerin-like receptor 1 [Pseudophryne corroboree]|uniref:chemerin-like receptor 1 n=1 Tax=Pseudophryne corroboree TaxID=495146 RepID=UPI003082056F
MENISMFDSSITFNNTSRKLCYQTEKVHNHITQFTNVSSGIIYSLAFLLGTTSNGFVLWIKVTRMEKTYRSILFQHFLISGFIYSLFLPLDIVYFASGNHWPFGSFMCRVNSFIFYLNMFLSAFILTLFSIDYCIVIVFPFRYNSHRRPHLATKEVILIWILAVYVSVSYFVFKNTYDCHGTTKCLNSFDYDELNGLSHTGKIQYQAIVIFAFIEGFVLPFLIILSCFIVTALLYHRKKSSKYTTSLKLIFSKQILFAICWFPYHVFSFLKLTSFITGVSHIDEVAEISLPITMSLTTINIWVNPLLYAFICPDFKKVFSIQSIFSKNISHQRGTI